jgi:hypothetical protein
LCLSLSAPHTSEQRVTKSFYAGVTRAMRIILRPCSTAQRSVRKLGIFLSLVLAVILSASCYASPIVGDQSSPTSSPGVPLISTVSLIRNGGFESGSLSGWKAEGAVTVVKSYKTTGYTVEGGNATEFSMVKAHSGSWFLILGKNKSPGTVSQRILLPPETISANLSFWYACVPTAGSRLSFSIDDDKGKSIKTVNFTATAGWRQFTFDLNHDYFGQSVTIRFRGIGISNFMSEGGELITYECLTILDDVGFDAQTNTSIPSPTPTTTPTTTPTATSTTSSAPSPEPAQTPVPAQNLTSTTTLTTPVSEQPISIGVIVILIASILPVVAASAYIRRKRHYPLKRD